MKIGLARGFYFYRYFPLWSTFFDCLGSEVLISEPTDEALIRFASMNVEEELCLPAKVYLGHIHRLKEKADLIFAPDLYSLAPGTYTCPKIISSSRIARALWRDLPPLYSPAIWFYQGDHEAILERCALDAAAYLGKSPDAARGALKAARESQRTWRSGQVRKWAAVTGEKGRAREKRAGRAKAAQRGILALLAHPYVTGDPFLSRKIPEYLQKKGFTVLCMENVPEEVLQESGTRWSLPAPVHWISGKELLEMACWSLHERMIDGVIGLSYFNCGLDSFTEEILIRRQKGHLKPFLSLTVDEHTAQSHIWNRVDAFLDIVSG